jgi:hypothetical protein
MRIKDLIHHPQFPHQIWVVVEQSRDEPYRMALDGDILVGVICGVFFRHDGDHKFVAVDEEWASKMAQVDLFSLDPESYANVCQQYPRVGENEGWFGAETARTSLKTNLPSHD